MSMGGGNLPERTIKNCELGSIVSGDPSQVINGDMLDQKAMLKLNHLPCILNMFTLGSLKRATKERVVPGTQPVDIDTAL